jgi:hypothetical protein
MVLESNCWARAGGGGHLSWSGDASAHWEALAVHLDGIATRSKVDGVRCWARDGARELRTMAEHDRKRETEERVRGYS